MKGSFGAMRNRTTLGLLEPQRAQRRQESEPRYSGWGLERPTESKINREILKPIILEMPHHGGLRKGMGAKTTVKREICGRECRSVFEAENSDRGVTICRPGLRDDLRLSCGCF